MLIVHIFARRAKKKIKGTAFALPRFFFALLCSRDEHNKEKNLEPQATLNKDHFYTIYVSAVYKLAVLQDSLKCQTITMGLVEIQFQGVK